MTTTEKNAVIARFMGITEIIETNGIVYKDPNSELFYEIKYHSDWNWIMNCVEKIENLSYNEDQFYNVIIGYGLECTIQGGKVNICEAGTTKLEAVYLAVYYFALWHNQSRKRVK